MADQFNSVSEVGHAMRGIRDQLRLHVIVFGSAASLVVLVLGALFVQYGSLSRDVNDLRVVMARVESKIDAIRGDTQQTRSDVGEVKSAMATVPTQLEQWTPSEAEEMLLAKFRSAFGMEAVEVGGPFAALSQGYARIEEWAANASSAELKDLQTACLGAGMVPELYSTITIGACAAVVNVPQNR